MTLKRFPVRGLLALASAMLLAHRDERRLRAFIHAQAPASRRRPRRCCCSGRRAPAPPACDAKTLEKCTPNSGDTAWMLTSMAIVLMMTIPGLALFYGGMVRKKTSATP